MSGTRIGQVGLEKVARAATPRIEERGTAVLTRKAYDMQCLEGKKNEGMAALHKECSKGRETGSRRVRQRVMRDGQNTKGAKALG